MPLSGSFLRTREKSNIFPLSGTGVVTLAGIEREEIHLHPISFAVFGEVSACVVSFLR